ncbi:MAG: RDD family protein [Phycisphaerales bacterium]
MSRPVVSSRVNPPVARILTAFFALLALVCATAPAQPSDAPVAQAARPTWLPSAGGERHGWFALPSEGLGFPALYHVPPESDPGTIRGGPRLRDFPEALASAGERVVIVTPPERLEAQGDADSATGDEQTERVRNDPPARLIRRVQWLRTSRSAPGSIWTYHPSGREPIAMPSLPGRGDLRGLAMNEHAVFALMQGAPASQGEHGLDGPREDRLYVLPEGAREWAISTLPSDWSTDEHGVLVMLGERLVLIQTNRAWESRPLSAEPGVIEWSPSGLSAPVGASRVTTSGSSLVVVHAEPERITLELVRESSRTPLATIEHQARDLAVVGGGEHVTVVWRGEGDPTRLRATVISAISGAVLYDDFARTNAVVSGREIQSLALLVGALMLTILVFVLRPEEALGGAVVVPPGYALAAPMRRVAAVLLDLAPMLVACAFAFGVSAREMLDAAVLSDDSTTLGAAALGVAFILTAVHSTLSEWLTGRTLGKAILRCRTYSVKGERPRLWQAALRTLVKLLFPPFALFLFLDIRRRHPGDLVAGTVVFQRHDRPEAGEESDPDQPERPS